MASSLSIDGDLSDWSDDDRLDLAGGGVAGYAAFARAEGDSYVIGLASGIAIGEGTTVWLNTDGDASTGHLVWDFAAGAEYHVEIGADGTASLYSGAPLENLVAAGLQLAYGADGTTLELAVDRDLLGPGTQAVDLYFDVNEQVYLPFDYSSYEWTVGEVPLPPVTVGSLTLDGDLADWNADDRLDLPGSGVEGYAAYGRLEGETHYVVALESDIAIGEGTTVWLNTDGDASTGHLVWDFAAGAEYHVEIGADGTASLYSGGPLETLVASDVGMRRSEDGRTLELAIDRSLLGPGTQAVDLYFDINEQVYLPNDYSGHTWTVGDVPPPPPPPGPVDADLRVGIVYSATSAANFYDETAYSQLFMAAQSQAMQAGLPYDILSEADLTDADKLAQYDTLVFPWFGNVPLDQVEAISDALHTAVYDHHVGLITVGDFMTGDENGQPLAGHSYSRMHDLIDLTYRGFGNADEVTVRAAGGDHPAMEGLAAGELIRNYENGFYSHFGAVRGEATVLATLEANGETYDAVLATETGGRNVHFATDQLFGDNNLLQKALQWSVHGEQPAVALRMTRDAAIVASRNDMDQSQETFDVSPEDDDGNRLPGIYDAMLPILEQWKADYDFVGSYYINVGDNPPDQMTDWSVSKPYYDALLAMGNEIGSHSHTHPHDVSELTPEQIAYEFGHSSGVLEQQLGIDIVGAAVPGASEHVEDAREIMQYFDYLSGGFSSVGAGYPGAFGYMTPGDTSQVYLAPNMSFDFTLIDFKGMSADEASQVWRDEFDGLSRFAAMPIVLWPWHDYGLTAWDVDPDDGLAPGYDQEMFTTLVAHAHEQGAEFVTLADLARRVAAFEQADLEVEVAGDVLTARVGGSGFGSFALDVDAGQQIASVDGWYAWDDDSVFLPTDGGEFVVRFGDVAADVTRIVELSDRIDLLDVAGDGTDLAFSVIGDGRIVVDLTAPDGRMVTVTGAEVVARDGELLTLQLTGPGRHDVTLELVDNDGPTADADAFTVGEDAAAADVTAVLLDGDADPDAGDVLRIVAVGSDGTLGEVTLVDGRVSYAPGGAFGHLAGGQTAVDSFTYTISDGHGGVATATATVTVVGADEDLVLTGTSRDDVLAGGGGNDRLDGRAGDDVLGGGDGIDLLLGGGGHDTLYGGAGDDRLEGQGGDDVLFGEDGHDVLIGSGGQDFLYGGEGDDTLEGLGGNDLMEGGAGSDRLIGAGGREIMYGGAGDDSLDGGNGNDQLAGGDGADLVVGGKGADELLGNAGDDVLQGDEGNDLLVGGGGDDSLSGGAGRDIFRFDGAFGDDVITDYARRDVLDFDGFSIAGVSRTIVDGDLVFTIEGFGSVRLEGVTTIDERDLEFG